MPRSTALSWATPTWPLREVAQPAVHQLGRPARGAEGEVVGVDGEHRAARGSTASRATPAPVMPSPTTTRSTSVGCVGEARRDARRAGRRHGRRSALDQEGELGVEVVGLDAVVDHRLRREHEAVGGEQQRAGHGDGVAGADRAGGLAARDLRRRAARRSPPASGRGGRAGRAASARGRARRSARTARCRAARRTIATRACDQRPSRGRPSAGSAARVAATTLAHSRVIRSPSSVRHVGPGAVDRHPARPRPAGDLGERRTPPADVEDAVAGGVEVAVAGRPLSPSGVTK